MAWVRSMGSGHGQTPGAGLFPRGGGAWALLELALCAVLSSCGPPARAQQLPDGTLRLECAGAVSSCIRRAQSFCGDNPLEVLTVTTGVAAQGGDAKAKGSRITMVDFTCAHGRTIAVPVPWRARARRSHASPAASAAAPPRPSANAPSTPPAAPSAVCTPGSTQQCVGAAACAGGQACLPDGSGWGPCDCGSRNPPTDPVDSVGSPPPSE